MDDIVEGVVRVMQGAPKRKNGEDGLPVPPYAVYNIGNQNPENLLDFVQILQEELIRAGVLPEDYDFEAHKKLVPIKNVCPNCGADVQNTITVSSLVPKRVQNCGVKVIWRATVSLFLKAENPLFIAMSVAAMN